MKTQNQNDEPHAFYPTRFFRWAYYPGNQHRRILQQLWRNMLCEEEWRGIPEVIVDPGIYIKDRMVDCNEKLNSPVLTTDPTDKSHEEKSTNPAAMVWGLHN